MIFHRFSSVFIHKSADTVETSDWRTPKVLWKNKIYIYILSKLHIPTKFSNYCSNVQCVKKEESSMCLYQKPTFRVTGEILKKLNTSKALSSIPMIWCLHRIQDWIENTNVSTSKAYYFSNTLSGTESSRGTEALWSEIQCYM